MATLEDDPDRVSALFYGSFGTGKTTAAATMAKLGVVKYIRPDRGVRLRPLKALGIPVDRIEPVDIFDPILLERAIEEWRTLLDDSPSALAGVVLDTTTELIGRRIELYVDRDWRIARNAAKAAHTELDRLDRYSSGDVRDQYRGVTQELRRVVRHLNDLPCHLVLTAQQREEAGQLMPDIPPALRGDMIGYVDFVIRLVQEGEWPDGRPLVVGYPKPTTRAIGKDRDGILPKRFADPTFERLVQYASGLTFQDDPVQHAYKAILDQRKKDDKDKLDD